MTRILIAHGGINELKLWAWREAFAALGIDVDVLPRDGIESGVDPQPFGGAMADLGAENRAIAAIKAVSATGCEAGSPLEYIEYGVGNESYLEFRRGRWLDFASCAIVRRRGEQRYDLIGLSTSAGLPCPQEYVLAALACGAGRVTAGEKYAAAVPGVDKANWHKHATNGLYSRRDLMVDACKLAISQVDWR
jgi:non-canonical (house-cleaning) NTP pyrophosphatase